MKRKPALLVVFIFAASLVVISTKYVSSVDNKGAISSKAVIREPDKMEGVSIKKQFGDAAMTIDAAILKPRMRMPENFLSMILDEDNRYSLRLRNVRFHLIEHAKDLLIEGPEALANAEFTSLKIKLHSVNYDGYKINPTAEFILIKISGNKVKVFS